MFQTFADDCLGRQFVDSVYNKKNVPEELRCRARRALSLHIAPEEIDLTYISCFRDLEWRVLRKIISANKRITEATDHWVKESRRKEVIAMFPRPSPN